MFSIVTTGLLLIIGIAAHPGKPQDYTLPISTTTMNYIWGLPEAQTNYDATTFNTKLGRWDANVTLNPISGGAPATGAYKISGTFCSPTAGGNGVVLLATHGFGLDRGYSASIMALVAKLT
jgi:hypothetical protein